MVLRQVDRGGVRKMITLEREIKDLREKIIRWLDDPSEPPLTAISLLSRAERLLERVLEKDDNRTKL